MGSVATTLIVPREESLQCLKQLPALSPMVAQVIVRLARPNCDVAELASFIEKDVLLSSQILRLANSALYARERHISSVKHAIAMVGVAAVRRFALGAFVSNLFRRMRPPTCFMMTRFNRHGVATGRMAELLSEELPVTDPDSVFAAGLFHDIGKLLLSTSMPTQYGTVVSSASINQAPLHELERVALGMDHAELSGLVIAQWNLPESIRIAARYHHAPQEAAVIEKAGRGKLPLSLLIHKADAFVNFRGMSIQPPEPTECEAPSLDFPGFSYSFDRVRDRFEAESKTLDQLFQ